MGVTWAPSLGGIPKSMIPSGDKEKFKNHEIETKKCPCKISPKIFITPWACFYFNFIHVGINYDEQSLNRAP